MRKYERRGGATRATKEKRGQQNAHGTRLRWDERQNEKQDKPCLHQAAISPRDNKNYRLSGLENNRSSGLPPDRGLHSLSLDTQAVAG